MMLFRVLFIGLLFAATTGTRADKVQETIHAALAGFEVVASEEPYSRVIQRVYIGKDAAGKAKIGIAYREIESFKPITGVVIVYQTNEGFILREAVFPDITKIKNSKDRNQVLTVLKQFRNVPFDPHAEKSAVDALSGATRYGIKTSGYLNYMARHVALQMENPPDWSRLESK